MALPPGLAKYQASRAASGKPSGPAAPVGTDGTTPQLPTPGARGSGQQSSAPRSAPLRLNGKPVKTNAHVETPATKIKKKRALVVKLSNLTASKANAQPDNGGVPTGKVA